MPTDSISETVVHSHCRCDGGIQWKKVQPRHIALSQAKNNFISHMINKKCNISIVTYVTYKDRYDELYYIQYYYFKKILSINKKKAYSTQE